MTLDRMGRMLVRIEAPHFVAGLTIGRKHQAGNVIVIDAAPILRWTLGRSWLWVHGYCARKRWTWTMQPHPNPGVILSGDNRTSSR